MKVTVSGNFYELQMLRNVIKDNFKVRKVLWGGRWDGMKWENLSFYCNPSVFEDIKSFSKNEIYRQVEDGNLIFNGTVL